MTSEQKDILNHIAATGIKALPWKQPYANLMLKGKIETRNWLTHYRGWVLICVSKTQYDDNSIIAISGGKIADRIALDVQHTREQPHLGHALAVGWLHDCRPMEKKDEAKCFVQYHPDLWCHVYKHVHAIEPFPYSNGQKWTIPSKEQISNLKFLIPHS